MTDGVAGSGPTIEWRQGSPQFGIKGVLMARHGPERDRPYDVSEPARVGELLSHLFAQKGFGRIRADRQWQETWRAAAGDELAQQSRATGLRNGVLQIQVANPALLSELAAFRKAELLEALQRAAPDARIRDLKFRRGGAGR